MYTLIIYFLNVYKQAKELERQRVLLIEGKTTECPKELANHPVFLVNQMTNNSISKRRSKVSFANPQILLLPAFDLCVYKANKFYFYLLVENKTPTKR